MLIPPIVNPFSRRSEFSSRHILLLKITTFLSYLILVVTAFYYEFNAPDHKTHKIWSNNRKTPFAQNPIITSIYWQVLIHSPSFQPL